MTATTETSPPPALRNSEKAITLALRLAHAEHALLAFTSGQADAIVNPDGKAYLLSPAQEHLRQKERRLQAIIESAADVITVVNRGGVIVSQSHAVTRVLGYEPEELVGSNFFDLIHEDDLPAVHFAFFNVIEGFDDDGAARFRHRAPYGSWRTVDATVGKLRDVSPASVVFCMRPFTSPFPWRTDPFWPGTLAVSPAGEDGEYMSLSHGRTIPFMGIRLGIDALKENLRNDSANLAIERVWQEHELEARLLEEPLDFTKSGRLPVRLRLESIDAHEVARSVVDLCHREIAARQVEVLLYLRAEENIVRADWARLLQAMCNLLRNAVECSSPESTISIASINGAPGRLNFELAARGIGVGSALSPRVFDSFQQGEASEQQLRRGLDIARRLAEAQGGTLTASSKGPGRGATFHLTLNTAPSSRAALAIVPPEEPGALAATIYEAVAKSLRDHSPRRGNLDGRTASA